MRTVLPRLLCICIAFAVLAGCAPKKPAPPPVYKGLNDVEDTRTFPQGLEAYLGPDRDVPILDAAQSAAVYASYRKSLFSPWRMRRPSVQKKDAAALLARKARGWKSGTARWTDAEWAAMRSNADMGSFPSRNLPGITLRATDLREMPTHQPRFTEPTPRPDENPFDYFQYSALPPGMPVLLCHLSKDGAWYYVETSLACGWVDAKDLAPVSADFMSKWQAAPLAAVVREGTKVGGGGVVANIGAVLPRDGTDAVLLPVRGSDGQAVAVRAEVDPGSVETMPVPMTPAKVAALGDAMVGQHYGWGGMLGLRDCSAMTRDLMAPFGIWLPRNSQAQGRAGEKIPLSGMGAKEKERTVLDRGVPFASLVVMKGHVVLYVGTYKGRPAILHDLWGIRVDEPKGEDGRLVIGRVVVTSMTPGRELPTLTEGKTIGDRFHTLTTLGGASRKR